MKTALAHVKVVNSDRRKCGKENFGPDNSFVKSKGKLRARVVPLKSNQTNGEHNVLRNNFLQAFCPDYQAHFQSNQNSIFNFLSCHFFAFLFLTLFCEFTIYNLRMATGMNFRTTLCFAPDRAGVLWIKQIL